MSTANLTWISRKEIALKLGVSYYTVANSEEFLGISLLRVRFNRRLVMFPREQTLQQLRERFPCLKL